MAKTAWIFSYKIKKNVTDEEFIEKTKSLHDEVISKAKGFISWEHYVQENTWTDFVLWETILDKGIMPSEKVLDFPVDCNTLTGSVNL